MSDEDREDAPREAEAPAAPSGRLRSWLGTALGVGAIAGFYYLFGAKVGEECGGFLEQCAGCNSCYKIDGTAVCASPCTSDQDCTAGFRCATSYSPSVCVKGDRDRDKHGKASP